MSVRRKRRIFIMRKIAVESGISLITLIITIIVIIILAAIVIFTGLDTPDRATFAKFVQEFSNLETAVLNEWQQQKIKTTMNGLSRTDAQIYYSIATGNDVTDINETPPISELTVESLALALQPDSFKGTYCYEITVPKISGLTAQTKYYEPTEKHYITDKGEVFVLPGYCVEEDGTNKWYVSSNRYYTGNSPKTGPRSVSLTLEEVYTSSNGSTPAGTAETDGNTLYARLTINADGDEVTGVTVGENTVRRLGESNGIYTYECEVQHNGTYTAEITVNGETKEKDFTISSYREPTLAERGYDVGQVVAYTPAPKSGDSPYTSTAKGVTATNVATESATWRILYVGENEIWITPGMVNYSDSAQRIKLQDIAGWINGPTEIEEMCKRLYSNKNLNITARSATIEEIETACLAGGLTTSSTRGTPTNYVYYASNSGDYEANKEVSGPGGLTYKMTIPSSSIRRFYTGNNQLVSGGVSEEYTLNSVKYPYRTPAEGNPVYVKNTYSIYQNFSYPTGSGTTKNITSVIAPSGSHYAWLASPCVYASSVRAGFYVRIAYASGVNYYDLAYSNGSPNYSNYGLLPLVSLSSSHLTGTGTVANSAYDPGDANNPWGVK